MISLPQAHINFTTLLSITISSFVLLSLPSPANAQTTNPTYEWTKAPESSDVNNAMTSGQDVAHDNQNNIYYVGEFRGTIDFNPGPGTEIKTSFNLESNDIYLTKINSDGGYAWTKTFQSQGGTVGSPKLVVDSQNNIFVMGILSGTIDFDPGPGVDIPSAGNYFFTKMNADGSYGWTRTFVLDRDIVHNNGFGFGIDSNNNFYLTGRIDGGTVDFDPGPGTDIQTGMGATLTKYNADGTYAWTKITQGDFGQAGGIYITTDSQNNVYVAGEYFPLEAGGTVDFDPGPGTDIREGTGSYVSKYSPSGSYIWTSTFEGTTPILSITTDSQDNVIIQGQFFGSVDFDPSEGVDIKNSGSLSNDNFVTKLNTNGTYEWTRTFLSQTGGTEGHDITTDPQNNIYTSGHWAGTVNFNPNNGNSDTRSGQGFFTTGYTSDGNYLFTEITSGTNQTSGALDISGNNIYMLGMIAQPMDFDPEGSHDIVQPYPNDNGQGARVTLTKYSLSAPNATPTVGQVIASANPIAVATSTSVLATFTDANTGDTHSAVWDWGDGTTSSRTINGNTVSGSHSYAAAGVYEINVTVTDQDNASGSAPPFQYLTVYDVAAGWASGSKEYTSPAGAVVSNPSVTGKVDFGFQVKYQQGDIIPSGKNVEFNFPAANLNFTSTSYQWLVVEGTKATLKATGTLNGTSGHTILISAIDQGNGQQKGLIRVQIKNSSGTVVYDTQLSAPDTATPITAVTKGKIAVH